MPIELAGIELQKISRMETLENAGFARHRVPGLDGEIAQNLGRRSVCLRIEGIFYGAAAAAGLEKLRKVYKAKEPVEFLADIIDKAYFAQVLLDRLDVVQDAQEPDQFSYALVITEFVKPPEPVLLEKPDVDLAILGEAQQFMDAVQLPDLLSLPEIKDPTTPLDTMLNRLKTALVPLDEEESAINKIFGKA